VQSFSTGGGPEADAYLGVGIADAVTTMLGGMSGPAGSPLGAVEDLADARALGLQYLLEGAVQRSDQRLQVSARLIDVASGRARWGGRFERPQAEGVALSDAIAEQVAGSIAPPPAIDDARLRSYRPR